MRAGTIEKVEATRQLIASGMSVEAAVKKTHISAGTWYRLKDQAAKTPKTQVNFITPEPELKGKRSRKAQANPLAVVFGTPTEIAEMIKAMRH
jgi:hypothetical protein